MSSSITGPSDYAFGSQLIANTGRLRQQVASLTLQSSTGYKSDAYSGLGSGASTALAVAPQIAGIKVMQDAMAAAGTRMQVSQTVMSQLSGLANTFLGYATEMGTTAGTDVDALASQARDALVQAGALLNTQSNGVYLFAGQDTANPPVPGATALLSSSYFTQIQAAVANLGANGAAATQASTLAAATTPANSVFSATLGTAVPSVAIGNGVQVATGLLANKNSVAIIPGTDTTGSATNDLMRALATLGSLSSTTATASGFSALVGSVATNLQNVVTALGTDAGALGARQNQVTNASTQLGDISVSLKLQLSNVEDADMPTVATQLTQAQTQLQASYQLISGLRSLSLVNYL